MLYSKQKTLVRNLSETVYHTSEELGELMGVSSKTVRTMVKTIKPVLAENGADIEATSRRGFRLVVTDRQRFEALRNTGRVEFGEGILGKLIRAFCDAPELQQSEYEETLSKLQALFYYYKNECADTLSDDELITALRLIYSERAHGSLDFFADIDRRTLYRIAKTGRLAGTELAGEGAVWDEA